MTKEEARKAAEVMLAYANGEEIEMLSFDEYVPCEEPIFNWITAKGVENYRIKPKERFDPKTLQLFDKVLVRRGRDKIYCWFADFVAAPITYNDTSCCTITIVDADMVIPYNDDTKHLVGTNKEAPEYYRYWD